MNSSEKKGPDRKAPPGENRSYTGDILPENMPAFEVERSEHYLPGLIVLAELAKTPSEARRLIENSGVSWDGAKVRDVKAMVEVTGEHVLRAGKRAFARIVAK